MREAPNECYTYQVKLLGLLLLLLCGGCDALITEAEAFPGDIEQPIAEPDRFCFAPSREAYEWYPEIDKALSSAGAAWRMEVTISDGCPSVTVRDLPTPPTGKSALAMTKDWGIAISKERTSDGSIQDVAAGQCADVYPLRSLLVHEIGHLLLGPEHADGGAMIASGKPCVWLQPSEKELDLSRAARP